ncbi:MAG: hypothetical protein GY814_03285 [Gammaproteobacteria bacterium]|nr:hypothetical protein [Gammaproteobacteria bacterium]
MLDYKNDRLDYGMQLVPPEGYALDRAVATTFSLDLDTLLSIPVALHFSQTLDGKLTGERFQVLEAIKRASKTVQIYCQSGRIKIPRGQNALYAYIEPMVHEILPGGPFESFHPKVWVLRYVAKDLPVVYRVLVMSRNLTFDRSWDLAASFEGRVVNKRAKQANDDLLKLLEYLNSVAPMDGYATLQAELSKVIFDTPDGFEGNPHFVLSGLDGLEHPVRAARAKRTLIISPFLHKKTLTRLRKMTKDECWLFGRHEELRNIPADNLSHYDEVYQISRLVVDGEQITGTGAINSSAEIDEEDSNEIEEQNLHAKLFVLEDDNNGVTWHLGSANATEAGMSRNTELGVELRGDIANVGIDQLLLQLLGDNPDKPLRVFERYESGEVVDAEIETEAETVLRQLEHELLLKLGKAKARITATAEKDKYDLTINASRPQLPKGCSIGLRPFNTQVEWALLDNGNDVLSFGNIPEHELSAFIEVQIRTDTGVHRQFLRKIDVDGMPDTRIAMIFRRIVENQSSFLRYIQFLLQDDINKTDLLGEINRCESTGDSHSFDLWAQDSELYERLLVAASRDPRRLRDIDALLQQIKLDSDANQVIPETFQEFWHTFSGFIPEQDQTQ